PRGPGLMAPVAALAALIATIREAGGTLRRDGDFLAVRLGRLDGEERAAVTVLLRRHKLDVLTLLDTETTMAVFPGARVVACPICGSTRWRQAGDREVCVVCHPAPGSTSAPKTESPRRRTVA